MQGEEIDYSTCTDETDELKDYVIVYEGKMGQIVSEKELHLMMFYWFPGIPR